MNEEIKTVALTEDTNETKQIKIVKRGVFAIGENITTQMLPYFDGFLEPDASDFDNNVDKTIANDIQQCKNMGGFIPKGLTPLILMDDGAGIMAKRVVGKKNENYIVVVYVYSDGSTSKEIRIEHSELHHVSKGNFGRKNDKTDKWDVAQAKKTLSKLEDKILPYWRPTIDISAEAIVQMLFKQYDVLAEEHIQTSTGTDIYKYMVEVAENGRNSISHFYIVRRKYYAFLEEHFLEIAKHFHLSKEELISELKEVDAFYSQESSTNELCKVKGVGYCYCIKMMKSRFGKVDIEDLSGDPYDDL